MHNANLQRDFKANNTRKFIKILEPLRIGLIQSYIIKDMILSANSCIFPGATRSKARVTALSEPRGMTGSRSVG